MRTTLFVERLLRRWRRRVGLLRPLGLVFRRAAARRKGDVGLTLSQTFAPRSFVELRPRLELTLVRHGDVAAGHAPGAVEHTFREGNERLVVRRASETAVERVVTRLLARGARADRGEQRAGAPSPVVAAPTRVAVAPARIVVRRDRPSATPRAAAAATTGAELARYMTNAAAPPAAAELPPLDVEQLTDRVVAAIDRRIVMATERTGRA